MTSNQIAWALRTVMVVVAAVVAYLLVQTEIVLSPEAKVFLGAVAVGLAALNPTTLSDRFGSSGGN